MHVDWDHDHRPAWDVALRYRTATTWDDLDSKRLARELLATGRARRTEATALDDEHHCSVRLRVRAETWADAAPTALAVVEAAVASLGIAIGDAAHLDVRPALGRVS